jgi:hypothetical protein
MSTLSVFIDESGTFSEYAHTEPYYIVTLVFHNQANDISEHVEALDSRLSEFSHPSRTIHSAPLIRRENEYQNMSIEERVRIFNLLFYFTRKSLVCFKGFVIEKRHTKDSIELVAQISKRLSEFLTENMALFMGYDKIIVYYDNGQNELTKIIVSVLTAKLGDIDYRKAQQPDYKLLQAADLFCTLQLLSLKSAAKSLSRSEQNFFPSDKKKSLRKSYLPILKDKAFPANL